MKDLTLLFMAGFGIQELIVILFFIIGPAILWLWAIIDLLKRDFRNSTNKLIWAMIIIFIPFFGALLYLITGRTQTN